MARNRKRAKERRARRPHGAAVGRPGVAPARADAIEPAPDPLEPAATEPYTLEHANPDVELAEAQIALGQNGEAIDQAEADREEELLEEEIEEQRQERSPAVARERVGLLARLVGFIQGSWRELQRVQWPDRRQVAQATGVVLGFVIVAGVFLGVADLLASHLMNYILNGHW